MDLDNPASYLAWPMNSLGSLIQAAPSTSFPTICNMGTIVHYLNKVIHVKIFEHLQVLFKYFTVLARVFFIPFGAVLSQKEYTRAGKVQNGF